MRRESEHAPGEGLFIDERPQPLTRLASLATLSP